MLPAWLNERPMLAARKHAAACNCLQRVPLAIPATRSPVALRSLDACAAHFFARRFLPFASPSAASSRCCGTAASPSLCAGCAAAWAGRPRPWAACVRSPTGWLVLPGSVAFCECAASFVWLVLLLDLPGTAMPTVGRHSVLVISNKVHAPSPTQVHPLFPPLSTVQHQAAGPCLLQQLDSDGPHGKLAAHCLGAICSFEHLAGCLNECHALGDCFGNFTAWGSVKPDASSLQCISALWMWAPQVEQCCSAPLLFAAPRVLRALQAVQRQDAGPRHWRCAVILTSSWHAALHFVCPQGGLCCR